MMNYPISDDRAGEIWRQEENYMKPLAFARAVQAEATAGLRAQVEALSKPPEKYRLDALVSVPRDLVIAACGAIDKKRDAPKVLEQLRRYTTGDLSISAQQAPTPTPAPTRPAVVEGDDTVTFRGIDDTQAKHRERMRFHAFWDPYKVEDPFNLYKIAWDVWQAAAAPQAREGWRLVPVPPTDKMQQAGLDAKRPDGGPVFDGMDCVTVEDSTAVFMAMVEAAPQAEVPGPSGDKPFDFRADQWWLPELEAAVAKHPMQPVVVAELGIHRFKQNAIVRRLLDHGQKTGLGPNELACEDFTAEDRMQLAQLIGYSVGGYCDLSYVSDQSAQDAMDEAAGLADPSPDAAPQADEHANCPAPVDETDAAEREHMGCVHCKTGIYARSHKGGAE